MNQSSALYGKSFYDLAKEEKITKEVLEEMELVKALFQENPDYIRLLLEPSIPKKERLSLLDQAFSEELQPYLYWKRAYSGAIPSATKHTKSDIKRMRELPMLLW